MVRRPRANNNPTSSGSNRHATAWCKTPRQPLDPTRHVLRQFPGGSHPWLSFPIVLGKTIVIGEPIFFNPAFNRFLSKGRFFQKVQFSSDGKKIQVRHHV